MFVNIGVYRLPIEAIKDLADELSEFELPARQLDAEIIDEFHSQDSEIRQRGKDHRSSISSNPPVIPQNFSNSSIAASSENSEDGLFQSFIQSPGSARSNSSSPEQLFRNHFQAQDEPRDEILQEALTDDEEVTGSAANLILDPEPIKTPEPREPETETNIEPERRYDEPTGMNTPTRVQRQQETGDGEEITEGINNPRCQNDEATNSITYEEESRPLDDSTTTEDTRRRSSRRSIPTDRYSAEFKVPENPKSKRGARSSIAPSLKSLKASLKESWAQRPDSTAPLRRRSKSRESSSSTRTRAASLERVQTGSIKNIGSIRSSVRTRYKVANQSSYVQGADESSWSDTEDEADRSSNKVKEGINTISGQKSKIAKVKNSVTFNPGQGAWVYLAEDPEQVSGDDFIFPILFNTIVEKNLFASKFSPRAGVLRSPAIYMINHNNDIFVQMKKGESVG